MPRPSSIGVLTESSASASNDAGSRPAEAEGGDGVCSLLGERLRLAARWRREPRGMLSHIYCDEPGICAGTRVGDDGLLAVAYRDPGPGVSFYFELPEESNRVRLECASVGMAAVAQPEKGVERCARVEQGALRAMTLIFDSRCQGMVRVTLFDDAYLKRDSGVAGDAPCNSASSLRQTSSAVLCVGLRVPD